MSEPLVQNLLQLKGGAKSFGTKTLFENATFSVNVGEHIGLIGPNGAGKTTLFKILAGELEMDRGEISRSRNLSVGYLRQHDTWDPAQSVESYLEEGTVLPIWELKRLAVDLGLKEAHFDAPVGSLSGGYRMRIKLLHLLGQQPNLMMLDEPTNYLDLETLLVLEEFLQAYEGAILLISHDREFLKRTTNYILEIEGGEFVKFSGNIDDYFEQKQMLREQLEKRAMTEAAKRKEVLDFAARFGAKASKAKQVQSRLKQFEKREKIEVKPLPIAAKLRIPEPSHTGRVMIEVKDCDFGYGEKVIIDRAEFNVESGDRIGVVGLNGAGKSTLLKSLAKEITPLHGEVRYGYQVTQAYYAQHVAEKLLPSETVHEALSRAAHPTVKSQEILDIAGSLLFSGDDVKKKVSVLSGGEKARVCLGQMLLKKAPLLLLDEPTNHLDFYTVESLTQALETYKGCVIIVSHDRGFISRISTRIIEVDHGKARFYLGNYDEYVWSLNKRRGESTDDNPPAFLPRQKKVIPQVVSEPKITESDSAPATSTPKQNTFEIRKEIKVLEKSIQEVERKIKTLQARVSEQSEKFSTAKPEEMEALSREVSAGQKKVEELEGQYLEMIEKKDLLSASLNQS